MSREVLQQAHDRLEWFVDSYPHDITTSKDEFLRPIKEALAQPERADNGITVDLLEKLKATLTKLGYATPEGGLEQFGARLPTQLYNLCRAVDGLLDTNHSLIDKGDPPKIGCVQHDCDECQQLREQNTMLDAKLAEIEARSEPWTPEDTAYRPGGLAQPEQEPVDAAYALADKVRTELDKQSCPGVYMNLAWEAVTKNYTAAPPQRQPLTHEQRIDLLIEFAPSKSSWNAESILIDMVEAAHGIGDKT